LREFAHSTQTDLLVGLPNEDFNSLIRSLETALKYGIDLIMGGEIRMLPGSELDSSEDRKNIRSKLNIGCAKDNMATIRANLFVSLKKLSAKPAQ
jgi:coproporphyrinogen III oxidase-like Fe-S oxidoreductase